MRLARAPRVGDAVSRTRCAESSRLGGVSRRLSSLLMLAGAVVGLAAAPAHAEGAADTALARQHWVLNCMGCHTATGGGIPGKVPPLANSLGYFTHLPAGREYVMRVPGASNSALSDQDLADVLNWVLTTMNRDALPRDFKPYTAAEVAAHRRPAFSDVATVRAGLVRALQARGIDGVTDRY
ncbi:c-type cytochrome [Burkholderia lata]|uniref:c-type cytochrome n=1 Tax=Burkholderia lata (strain ATCC 17760 / DSM 23089 / LMG 22485 / NCIMB 9086 / R18194 / 383) TaxID=482957 RepID=UPI0015831B41